MASQTAAHGLNDLPDPVKVREERDRAIALAFVRGTSVAQIVADTRVNYRTVYRAIGRERAWALAQIETPPADTERG